MHHHIDSLFALLKKLCSLNDDAYMSTMGVGSNNSHWSQTNDIHSKTMSLRWTRRVRALSTHRKEERAITPTSKTSYYAILGCKCRGIHPLEVIKVEMLIGGG